MEDRDQQAETNGAPLGIGARLRAAREVKGLTLEQVAAQTRIPQRHLQTIEAGDYAQLPGRTYAVGFVRTYAKTVGLDQNEAVAAVRSELDAQAGIDDSRPATFEPGDPARVPSRMLGWFALFALLLLLAGGFAFFRTAFSPAGELPVALPPARPAKAALLLLLAGGFAFFRTAFSPAGELPSLVEQEEARQAAARRPAANRPQAAPTGGAVVFTALDGPLWVKFYDASGAQLMQAEMARGDTYTVPADANRPMIWTGRPDALAITVGGRTIPKLAEEQTTIRDVPVTAEALLQRNRAAPAGPAAPAGENTPAPAN